MVASKQVLASGVQSINYVCNHIFTEWPTFFFDLFVFCELEVSSNFDFQGIKKGKFATKKNTEQFLKKKLFVTDQNGKACNKYIMIFFPLLLM